MIRRHLSDLFRKALPASFVSWLTESGSGSGDGGESRPGRGLSQPYAKSAWVFRCLQHIAGPIKSVPLEITDEAGNTLTGLEATRAQAFLRSPVVCAGERLARPEAEEALLVWLNLVGEGCLVYDDIWLAPILTGRPAAAWTPLMLIRPADLVPVADDGDLIGWTLKLARGRRQTLLPGQLGQMRFHNPYEAWRGLAPWEGAAIAAGADYAAARYARNLSEANGDRGDYIMAKGALSQPQRDQITTALREKRRMGLRGEYRPVFLTGEVDVKSPTAQAVDAAFAAQRLANREEIFVAFGVPPSFGQVTASYSVGSASDRYRLIEETCTPQATMLDGLWSEAVSRLLGRPITVTRDWDEHSTMQQVRQERMAAAKELFDRGWSWSDIDDYLRLKAPDWKGKDRRFLPMNLVPLDEPVPDASAAGQKGGTLSAIDDLESLMRDYRPESKQAQTPEVDCPHCKDLPNSGDVGSEARSPEDQEALRLWGALDRQRNPWRKRFETRFRRVLMKARSETLARIAERYRPAESKGLTQRAGAHEMAFDPGSWSALLGDELAGVMQGAISDAVRGAQDELGQPKDTPAPVGVADPNLAAAVAARRQNLITQTGVSIWGDVVDQIAQGIDAGESIEDMNARLRNVFNGIDKVRGQRIAVTETTAIFEAARLRTFEATGVRYKEWLTSRDDRVRDDHQTLSGQRVAISEPFITGIKGERLMHPGDHRAPLNLTVNCRCVMVAKSEPKP